MKRLILLAAIAAPMAIMSCNTSELQRLQAENDSLKSVATSSGITIDDYLQAFNSIQENLNAIKEKEKIISVKTDNGEIDPSSANQINNDIATMYELMQKNKETINDLNAKLNKSGAKNKELAKTIQLLNEQITTKDKEVTELKTKLETLHVDLSKAEQKVAQLDSTLQEMQNENEMQSEVISAQDAALNTVYYVVGSKKELISRGILSREGMFKGLKIGDSFDKNYFTQGDKREISSITIGTKKVNLTSSHPSSSYKLVERGNITEKLEITDPVAFWSRSNFLVIIAE